MPRVSLRRLALAHIPALFLALGTPLSAATLVHAGHLIDGTSERSHAEVTVVINDGRITEIRKGFSAGADGDTVIDLSDATVMPGLMDMHVHLTGQMNPKNYLERVQKNTAHFAIQSVEFARRTLMAGFTTVRNPGDDGTITIALRDQIARGIVPGPRIFTAGKSLATTGGHADPTNGLRDGLTRDAGPEDGVVNGPEDAAKAVRHRYKEGADFIKITATGGVLSVAKSGQNPQFTEAELEAIVQTANDYGFHVAAHAHGAEGMKRAVRAGITSIEHGTLMDDETMDLMKEHGTYYVPTILAGEFVAEKAKIDGYFPEIVRPKAAEIGPKIQTTFGKAYKAGVKIAFGTDCGVSPHGGNAEEFALMVEAGMPPMEAIQSATMATAELLKIDETLGSIEAGKIADLVGVRGDPLEDISVLEDISFVMKEGVVYKDERYPRAGRIQPLD